MCLTASGEDTSSASVESVGPRLEPSQKLIEIGGSPSRDSTSGWTRSAIVFKLTLSCLNRPLIVGMGSFGP